MTPSRSRESLIRGSSSCQSLTLPPFSSAKSVTLLDKGIPPVEGPRREPPLKPLPLFDGGAVSRGLAPLRDAGHKTGKEVCRPQRKWEGGRDAACLAVSTTVMKISKPCPPGNACCSRSGRCVRSFLIIGAMFFFSLALGREEQPASTNAGPQ